ncbi:MAG: glycosyltransferase family 39 protein, partial [Thermodesulfobacteriota bacterium]
MIVKIFLLLISISFLTVSVTCQLRLFRIANTADKFLACFVLGAANLVFTTLVLSELYAISATGYLLIELLIAALSIFALRKLSPAIAPEVPSSPPAAGLASPWKDTEKVVLTGLSAAIILTALASLFLVFFVPPNNYDSMTNYMVRVGYWLQQGSLRHYDTQNVMQLFMAPNAGVFILWTVAFLKSDILANLFQWISYCTIGVAIYRVSKLLGGSARASLFASLIYLSLKMVVLQSTSTQHDLVLTAFTLISFYFFHSGIKEKNRSFLFISAIACGLALGTKGTIFYMLPPLTLATIVVAFIYRPSLLLYLRWLTLSVVFFLLLGSYNYILNYMDYGNLFAPKGAIDSVHKDLSLDKAKVNMARYVYDSIEFNGLPMSSVKRLERLKESLGRRYLSDSFMASETSTHYFKFNFMVNDQKHEDVGWFGFLGFFFYLPLCLWVFISAFYRKRFRERLIYVFIFAGFFVLMSF